MRRNFFVNWHFTEPTAAGIRMLVSFQSFNSQRQLKIAVWVRWKFNDIPRQVPGTRAKAVPWAWIVPSSLQPWTQEPPQGGSKVWGFTSVSAAASSLLPTQSSREASSERVLKYDGKTDWFGAPVKRRKAEEKCKGFP